MLVLLSSISYDSRNRCRRCYNTHEQEWKAEVSRGSLVTYPVPLTPLSSSTQAMEPHLSIGEVRHGIEVGGDKLAARVLVDAQLRVLNLVVINRAVEADNDGCIAKDTDRIPRNGRLGPGKLKISIENGRRIATALRGKCNGGLIKANQCSHVVR